MRNPHLLELEFLTLKAELKTLFSSTIKNPMERKSFLSGNWKRNGTTTRMDAAIYEISSAFTETNTISPTSSPFKTFFSRFEYSR